MFIQVKRSGYDRQGQQFCSGLFLILTQPKTSDKYPDTKDECFDCGRNRAAHEEPLAADVKEVSDKLHRIFMYLFKQRSADQDIETLKDASEIILETKRQVEGCRYFRAKSIRYPVRAIVRHVAMSQLGHFMMGFARVKGERLTLSGSYGADGLPDSVSAEVYESGIELPQELYDAWNNGGGWNGVGAEAPAMRRWALEHLKELRA